MGYEATVIIKINYNGSLTWIQSDKSYEIADFSALPKQKARVFVLVSGKHCFNSVIELPKTSERNCRKALPYLLENQLLTNPENLHCVVKRLDKKQCRVVGMVKELLMNYVEQLQAKGYHLLVVVPDYLALPLYESRWTIYITGTEAIVRTGMESGFSTSTQHLLFLLESFSKTQSMPASCHVINDSSFDISLIEQKFNVSLSYQLDFDTTIPRINLLPKASQPIKKYWYYAIFAFSLWAMLFSVEKYDKFSQKTADPVQPVLQQKIVARQDLLITLLSAVAEALSQSHSIELQSIEFSSNSLHITVKAAQFADLDNFSRQLEAAHLTITHSQINATEKSLNNVLAIESRLPTPEMHPPQAMGDLMTTVERTLAQEKLTPFLRQVTQPISNEVSITFGDVPFDQAVGWLQRFTQRYSVKTLRFRSIRGKLLGITNTEVILQKLK